MGMLFEAYMKAFKIDIVLLCVTVNTSYQTIFHEIERMKATGIKEVIIVISENQYDNNSYESATGMRYYKYPKEKQIFYYETLKEKNNHNQIYSLHDFDNIDSVNNLINLLIN